MRAVYSRLGPRCGPSLWVGPTAAFPAGSGVAGRRCDRPPRALLGRRHRIALRSEAGR